MQDVNSTSFVSFVLKVAMNSPFLRTETLSETAMTSLSLWVMRMIDFPSSLIFLMTVKRTSVSWGVKTAVGSSRIRMSTSRYKTLTISTSCFSDTDMSEMTFLRSTLNPYLSMMAWAFLAASFLESLSLTPRMMFSNAVKFSTRRKCWWTIPRPKDMASLGERISTSSPSMRISPVSGE